MTDKSFLVLESGEYNLETNPRFSSLSPDKNYFCTGDYSSPPFPALIEGSQQNKRISSVL